MELHFDLVGGLAGDMFNAALLDAFPEHEPAVLAAIEACLGAGVCCALTAHTDRVLRGRRFHVRLMAPPTTRAPQTEVVGHSHASWAEIRALIAAAPLSPAVIAHAIQIFQLLADAEAYVHGIDVEAVSFHEVGAWDSIADIVGAATLIDVLALHRCTSSPIPLGSGRITTAHGVLPVPAPATARLLAGMTVLDDGVAGERVTPTGAALLRYLCPPSAPSRAAHARKLLASGTGFGSRQLPGLSNHVRVLCFESVADGQTLRRIEVLEFEVDDQSGEDLAVGLDRLRSHPGVLDVTQAPVFGKKGRIMIHVQVLARATQVEAVIEACFRETTTLGLRRRAVTGVGLDRQIREVPIEGTVVRVKVSDRPGGRTAKTESDDILAHSDHAHRAALRRRAESEALAAEDPSHA